MVHEYLKCMYQFPGFPLVDVGTPGLQHELLMVYHIVFAYEFRIFRAPGEDIPFFEVPDIIVRKLCYPVRGLVKIA